MDASDSSSSVFPLLRIVGEPMCDYIQKSGGQGAGGPGGRVEQLGPSVVRCGQQGEAVLPMALILPGLVDRSPMLAL